ncbi:MAG: polysaccharide deacetylase family protein [Dehalococcoidales bacterium]|nr:polysaccharide deacetylase family protein [Dehalococcoidales bacterium]
MPAKGDLIVTTSWDDGTVTDLKLSGLLDKYGIKGTFYISRDSTQDLLGEADILSLSKLHEIGAHTLSHPDLTLLPLPEAIKEIEGSKRYLEGIIGHKVEMFCYPKGGYNDSIKEIVRKAGFIGARVCISGLFALPQDPYKLRMTLLLTNYSPLMALKICVKARLFTPGALFDWERRAKLLFDLALRNGGVYHMYGHSAELESKNEWGKIERVLQYVSNRENVKYLTNGEIFSHVEG